MSWNPNPGNPYGAPPPNAYPGQPNYNSAPQDMYNLYGTVNYGGAPPQATPPYNPAPAVDSYNLYGTVNYGAQPQHQPYASQPLSGYPQPDYTSNQPMYQSQPIMNNNYPGYIPPVASPVYPPVASPIQTPPMAASPAYPPSPVHTPPISTPPPSDVAQNPSRGRGGPPRGQAGPPRGQPGQAGPPRGQAGPPRGQAGPPRGQASPSRGQSGDIARGAAPGRGLAPGSRPPRGANAPIIGAKPAAVNREASAGEISAPQVQAYPPQTQVCPAQVQAYPPQAQAYPPQAQAYPPAGHYTPPVDPCTGSAYSSQPYYPDPSTYQTQYAQPQANYITPPSHQQQHYPVSPACSDEGPIELKNYMWKLIVERGSALAAKDSNGKSDPYVIVELVTAVNKNGQWTNIKTAQKTVTPVVEKTLDPTWNFQAYLINAEKLWSEFNGVKFSVFDKDLIGTDDFMGEVYAWFDQDLPAPPETKTLELFLQPRPKKRDKVSGFLSIKSEFQSTQQTSSGARPPKRQLQGTLRATDGLKRTAVQRSKLVQISATGRREVKIPTTGMEKFISFGELPKFETVQNEVLSRETRKYGFSDNIALWLVTCCCLAYKSAEVVGEVVRNVWDMLGFKFIDNVDTDTQGFLMHNDEILVVCFRGTESIRDWITNLNFLLIETGQFPQRYLKAGVRVHQGFNSALDSVWTEIDEFVTKAMQTFPNLKIFICGHSLGGALANLCLAYMTLSDYPREVAGVYTIGQPRVGNKKFKEALDFATPNTCYIRITNNQDCVPNLASGQHCGLHVHIDATGRLTFDPPVWKKAVQKAQSLSNSAISMQYAGLADHSSPVYKRMIESHWVKSQFARNSGDNSYATCEQILYVIDMLQEDVKSVRRYKIQFRAMLSNVICSKQLISVVEDYLAAGIDSGSRAKLTNILLTYFELLSKFRKEVIARHTKKSMLQEKSSKSALKAFNSSMTKLAKALQASADQLHQIMTSATIDPANRSENLLGWVEVAHPTMYDPSSFNVQFDRINFEELSQLKPSSGSGSHVSQILEQAELMIEEGHTEQALQVLQTISSNCTEAVGSLGEEDATLAAFLTAKAHAKLHHHNEAVKALAGVSNSSFNTSLFNDACFLTLKNNTDFAEMQRNFNSQVAAGCAAEDPLNKLNNFEIFTLAGLFDMADDNGDNFLTSEELNNLLNTVGGTESILNTLGWTDSGVEPVSVMNQIFMDIRTQYRNAVDLDQFMRLMCRLAPV